MPTTRVRQWLMDHPEALTLAFLFVLNWSEYVPDNMGTQAATGYAGP